MDARHWSPAFLAVLIAVGSAHGRNVEEILRDKGVLTEQEAAEASGSGGSSGQVVPAWLSRITFSGDVRVRLEGFVFGDDRRDRYRARVRLRAGARFTLTDEVETGLRLASGNPDDPVSTNQSFSDVFDTKNVGIDNAYLKVAPARSIGLGAPILTVIGGKFDLPVYRPTETVFDSDLRPEGFHQLVNLYDGPAGQFALQTGQWSAREVASGRDSWIFSGQGIARLPLPDPFTFRLALADYGFVEADGIARERNTNSALLVTNDVLLSDGTVVGGRPVDPSREGPNGDGLDANGNPIRIVGFADGFNVLNVSAELGVVVGPQRWPLAFLTDWAQNLEASGDDTAVLAGFRLGEAKKPGEVALHYLWGRKETNSVVSTLTFSDFGPVGGTNVEGHQIGLEAGLIEALTGAATFYVTEPIDEMPGVVSGTSFRFQLDVIAKF